MFRYLRSMKFALNGLFYALRTEKNVQIWFGVMLTVFATAIWLQVSQMEFIVIALWMCGIGTSEYLNTAIEKLSDRVTVEYDEQIKRVKDIAAGATFIIATGAFICCLIIFVPKILEKFEISI